ncbi:MAG TPA: TIR domain-containing protein [Bryobacteraceae bacterium]|jgi:predicted nucleotide-binding protein|nr:TIR domain-containing protein [Bryobacteraceae bacterium]
MTGRFATKAALTDALKKQKIIAGNADLAEAIAGRANVMEVPAKTVLIHQGGEDNDVYLILDGSFHITVNGRTLARRIATDHIGEMAALLPLQRRAANVVAHEDSVVVKLSNSQISELGNRFPQIWRFLALELAHRLEQRNALASSGGDGVRVFILASSADSEIGRAVESACADHGFQAVVWSEGSFGAGSYAVDKLEEVLDRSDVAIAIIDPQENAASRDSVIFELGFFMGRLGRHRTFLVEPRAEDLKLPPEFGGIHAVTYNPAHDSAQAGAGVCKRLAKAIRELGPTR